MSNQKPVPGTGGDHYIPYTERTGEESVCILPGISRPKAFRKFSVV